MRASRSSGGHRLLHPFTHTRAKYHQPHRSGGQTIKNRYAGKTIRVSMEPAASQSYRRTAGDNRRSWVGGANKRQTGGEEARGGERNSRAGNLAEDMDIGAGEYRREGRGGGPEPSVYRKKVAHNPKYRPEVSVWVAAVRGLEPKTTLY